MNASRLIALALIFIGILASSARAQTLDRAYKGSLECEEIPAGNRILHTSLTMIVRNGNVMAMFDVDTPYVPAGRKGLITALPATGTVNESGVFHFGHTVFAGGAEFHGEYTGTLNGTGGTLTGTQVWTRPTDSGSVTRTCRGTVLEVGLPRKSPD